MQFTFIQMTTDPAARVTAVWHTNPADMPVLYAGSEAAALEYAQQWLLKTLLSSPSSVIINHNAHFSFGVGGSKTSEGCNERLKMHVGASSDCGTHSSTCAVGIKIHVENITKTTEPDIYRHRLLRRFETVHPSGRHRSVECCGVGQHRCFAISSTPRQMHTEYTLYVAYRYLWPLAEARECAPPEAPRSRSISRETL